MTQIRLYALHQMNLAQQSVVYISLEAQSRHETSNLSQNGEVSDIIEEVQLLKGVRFLFKHCNIFRIPHIQMALIRYLKLTLDRPLSSNRIIKIH
jgi:hypothetical protein